MIDFQNKEIIKLGKVKIESVEDQIAPLLITGESILGAYKSLRDYVVFTDKRVISVNVQGVTGKRKDYTILPYSKIQAFSIETAGVIDLDSELELYFSGGIGKITFDFSGFSDILDIGRIISEYIL